MAKDIVTGKSRGSVDPVVNYVIDHRTKTVHGPNHVQPGNNRVTAEDLNPAYVESHGYKLCECLE